MIFSDGDILDLLEKGRIIVDPKPDPEVQVGPCSLDLRLGNTFSIFKHSRYPWVDVHDSEVIRNLMDQVIIPEREPFIMQPKEFVLAVTFERVEIGDDIVARLEGRSSLGRLGIIVHATASIIDPGWRGNIVLELANHGVMPVALYPKMRICSLTFESLSHAAKRPYHMRSSSKYVNQTEPQVSRIAEDKDSPGVQLPLLSEAFVDPDSPRTRSQSKRRPRGK